MKSLLQPVWLIVALLSLSSGVACGASPVKIELQRSVYLDGDIVDVGDVARVTDGSFQMRQRILKIDLWDFKHGQSSPVITRSQLEIRLLLAGFSKRDFQVFGANATRVTRIKKAKSTTDNGKRVSSDQHVTNSIARELASLWNLRSDQLEIRLTKPLSNNIRDLLNRSAKYRVSPIPSKNVIPGDFSIRIGIYDGDRLVDTFRADANAQVLKSVFVARNALRANQIIRREDVDFAERWLQGKFALSATHDLIGSRLRRNIQSGQILLDRDLYPRRVSNAAKESPDVQRKDIVRLVARKRGLLVTVPAAEAIDEGKVGDFIRVRNLKSRKIVTGRIVNSGEIEVAF